MENRCAREIRGPARNDVMIPVDNNKQRDDVQQRARVAHDWAVNSLLSLPHPWLMMTTHMMIQHTQIP